MTHKSDRSIGCIGAVAKFCLLAGLLACAPSDDDSEDANGGEAGTGSRDDQSEASRSATCERVCDHVDEAGCGADSRESCLIECEHEEPGCGHELAAVRECLADLASNDWECAEDGEAQPRGELCAAERIAVTTCVEDPSTDDSEPGDDTGDDSEGDGSEGSDCGAAGCTVQVRRGGNAPHAGRIDFDRLAYVCGSGMGLEIECGDVSVPIERMVSMKAFVVKGTAAVFTGFSGDCTATDEDPTEAVMVVDGPNKLCQANFDCAAGLDIWRPGDWLSSNPPRCDSSRRRMECDAPLRAETPAQWASLLVEDMTVPEDVQQWWDTDRHCLFECPDDVEAVRAEILAFDTISGVSGDPWSSFGIRHFMCCGTCL